MSCSEQTSQRWNGRRGDMTGSRSRDTILFLLLTMSSSLHALQQKDPEVVRYPGLSIAVGMEYEEGDYGTADTTETWTIPVRVKYRTADVLLEATIPYISAESTGVITTRTHGGRHMIPTTSISGSQSESGIGDISLGASYFLPRGTDKDLYLSVTGRVNLPTGDETVGLGKGETSYDLEFNIDKYLEKNLFFGTIGYEFVDEGVVGYDDILYGTVGAMHELDRKSSLGGSLYYAGAGTPGYDDVMELAGLVKHRLDKHYSLFGHVLIGLSDSAADWGAGLNLRYRF